MGKTKTLTREMQEVLNRHSAENASHTPNFILALYLMECLTAWHNATKMREKWYGPPAAHSAAKE